MYRVSLDTSHCVFLLHNLKFGTHFLEYEQYVDKFPTTGCGQLWVTDGIWKTVFPHCMFKVEVCLCWITHCTTIWLFHLSRQVHYTPLGGVNKFSNGQHCLINCTFPFQSDSKGHWTADLR